MNRGAWKFDELKAPRPSSDMIKALYEDHIERVKNAESEDDVLEVLFENNLLVRRVQEMNEIISIRNAMDVYDERYSDDEKWSEEFCPFFDKLELDFKEVVYESPYREAIESQIGHMYFVKTEIKRKTVSDDIIAQMANLRKRGRFASAA